MYFTKHMCGFLCGKWQCENDAYAVAHLFVGVWSTIVFICYCSVQLRRV